MLKALLISVAVVLAVSVSPAQTASLPASLPSAVSGAAARRSEQYAVVQKRLQRGWNTWDTNSVAAEVLLPEGLEIRLGLKHNSTLNANNFLPSMLIGRQSSGEEQVTPGPHSWDGSYSRCEVIWVGAALSVEAAHAGDDLVMLVSPVGRSTLGALTPTAIFSVGFLWNRPGEVRKSHDHMVASAPGKNVTIYLAGHDTEDSYAPVQSPYFSADLDEPVGISTGKQRSLDEIRDAIEQQRRTCSQSHGTDQRLAPILEAIETTLGWDTIFEPEGDRVVTPVSRIWNVGWGGYVLFDWDTFFAADLAAAGSRDLAYANAMEILNEVTPEGFVPNYTRAGHWKSFDRSEPPVGAITVLALYNRFHDRWLLEDTFDRLLQWNRWWAAHRDRQGYLVWGSDSQNRPANADDSSIGTLQGAKYESGIDNGPQFDHAHYNASTHTMEFADVGLMGLYIADCDALAQMADILGRTFNAAQLRQRALKYSRSLGTLWDSKSGIFLNKDLHTGEFDTRLSPTNFYPLLAGVPTPEQADMMLKKHLLNPEEFWGSRVLPAIARNDPAFKDQDYWRGRIWAPMNYLVYLGLRNYKTPAALQARQALAARSLSLFLSDWSGKGHVHENYSALNDDANDIRSSDRFYHWGALLGLIAYEELGRPGRGEVLDEDTQLSF